MPITILGEHPLGCDAQGQLISRIATAFPRRQALVTIPGIHAWQRIAFVDDLNAQRQKEGLPLLTPAEESAEYEHSVDLIIEADHLLIRPDPANMPLAFEADEMLQQLVSKRKIKFLQVTNAAVRQAIKERGECWRISPLPRSVAAIRQMILDARIAIGGQPIYFYNRLTGTRQITLSVFKQLAEYPDMELVRHLEEIREYSGRRNRFGHSEVDFFETGNRFGHDDLASLDFASMDPVQLRATYRKLVELFDEAVPEELHQDDLECAFWRNRMLIALIGQKDETLSEPILRGLSPEYFLQVEWLPGGRFEEGELIFDSVFDELELDPGQTKGDRLDGHAVKEFIFNFIREFGDLEFVNIGRIVSSLSYRALGSGRRDVYLAEFKLRETRQIIVHLIRMQKWGIGEHLDEKKDLLQSITEAEDYTEYVLDRRLACRQLGMNLPARAWIGRSREPYLGNNAAFRNIMIWATYFERDYVCGMATDKLTQAKYQSSAYSYIFARLLGEAAAANIIVGRVDQDNRVLFDDGDEVVVEDAHGLPSEIVVSDMTGSFNDYESELTEFTAAYAQPVNQRLSFLSRPEDFARVYVDSLVSRLKRMQGDYRKRKRAFDTLFKHRTRDIRGSFRFRWEKTLQRLDNTDPRLVGEQIRGHIKLI